EIRQKQGFKCELFSEVVRSESSKHFLVQTMFGFVSWIENGARKMYLVDVNDWTCCRF
ncbi:unnamed protein product, partial [Musa banksii]